jgi:hypothetical protein
MYALVHGGDLELSDGDSPQFIPLVETTSRNFVMNEVSADKAYSSQKNLQLVLVKGAQPYIPFRSNSTAKSSSETWKRMFHLYGYNQEWFKRIAVLICGLRCSSITTTSAMNSWPTITSGQTWRRPFQ